MKCADAKTWLSFVTATRNWLPAAIPSPPTAFEQDDAGGGAGEIGVGAGVLGIAFVSQRAIEGGDRRSSRGSAHSPGIDHLPRPALHPDRFLGAEFARDVAVGPGREQREVRLDDRIAPGEPGGEPAREHRRTGIERRLKIGGVLAR